MRVMLKASFPIESGNRAIKDGTLGKTMGAFMDQVKPEAAYFAPEGGKRAAFFVFDMKDSSFLATVVEPLFLSLNASIEVTPVMNADELKTGLERLPKH